MMMLLAFTCLLAASAFAQETVPELDTFKYLGRWYQTYSNALVIDAWEQGGVCQTATYGIFNRTVLTVYNNQRMITPTGPNDDISGFAYATEEPGQLYVELEDVPRLGSYWVYRLGPVKEYNGVRQYSYSVISDPLLLVLFVLARDVAEFERDYEQELLIWLREFGFNRPLNKPVKSFQSPDCIYPWS